MRGDLRQKATELAARTDGRLGYLAVGFLLAGVIGYIVSRGPQPVPAPEEKLPLREASRKAQDAFERAYIAKAMKEAEGNLSAAARTLGMYRQTLQNKLRALGMDAAEFRKDGL